MSIDISGHCAGFNLWCSGRELPSSKGQGVPDSNSRYVSVMGGREYFKENSCMYGCVLNLDGGIQTDRCQVLFSRKIEGVGSAIVYHQMDSSERSTIDEISMAVSGKKEPVKFLCNVLREELPRLELATKASFDEFMGTYREIRAAGKGSCFGLLGKSKSSMDCFREAIRQHPEMADVLKASQWYKQTVGVEKYHQMQTWAMSASEPVEFAEIIGGQESTLMPVNVARRWPLETFRPDTPSSQCSSPPSERVPGSDSSDYVVLRSGIAHPLPVLEKQSPAIDRQVPPVPPRSATTALSCPESSRYGEFSMTSGHFVGENWISYGIKSI